MQSALPYTLLVLFIKWVVHFSNIEWFIIGERVFVSYVMTSIRGLDQTEGCNQHRRKAGFKHEENRRESQVVNRRCTKQDRHASTERTWRGYFNVITPCFWYIKLNYTIKSGHLCSLQLEPLKVVLIWAKLRWCYYLLYFTVINDKTKICFSLIRVNQGQSGIDAFFEIELYLFYNC